MLYYKLTALNSPIHRKIRTKPYPNCRPMNATHRSPLKLVKQSVGWNNAIEQICNQCTSCLSRYLWFTYESVGIFPTSSAVARSRFLAGVAITNISMQLALLYSELDYLTCNPTSRHGTGYTFTWSGLQLSRCGNMAIYFLMTISNGFSWKKTYGFRLRSHWSLFPRVQWNIFQHWFR